MIKRICCRLQTALTVIGGYAALVLRCRRMCDPLGRMPYDLTLLPAGRLVGELGFYAGVPETLRSPDRVQAGCATSTHSRCPEAQAWPRAANVGYRKMSPWVRIHIRSWTFGPMPIASLWTSPCRTSRRTMRSFRRPMAGQGGVFERHCP